MKKDPHALKAKQLFVKYLHELKNIRLLGFAICSGLSSSCIYVFGAEGPFIGINLLHVKASNYGFLGLIPYIGTLVGSLVAMKYSKLNPYLLLKMAFAMEMTAAIIMFLFFHFGIINLYSLLGPMVLLCVGHPILAGTAISMAMQEAHDKSNGSAIMNFTTMSVPVFTLILGLLHIGKAWVLPAIFSLILMALFYSSLLARRIHRIEPPIHRLVCFFFRRL